MALTFILLGLAIAAVWIRLPRVGAVWPVVFAAAVLSGLHYGFLDTRAVACLGALGGVAWLAVRVHGSYARTASVIIAGAIVLALSLHLVPGFANPKLLDQVQVGSGTYPVTQFLNFDKGAAGLVLLAAFSLRSGSLKELRQVAGRVMAVGLATLIVVFGLALGLHYVHFDPKAPPFAVAWLATNLFFTVVAEEAFFRGLLQERLTRGLAATPSLRWVPVAVSSALFGLAHLAGGAILALLATITGVGCSLTYVLTRRIEAPVLMHFAVNAVLFLGFSTT